MMFFKRKKKKYCYAVIESYYDEVCTDEFNDVLCIFSSKEKAITYIKQIDPLITCINDKYWRKEFNIFYKIEEFEIDEEVREDD